MFEADSQNRAAGPRGFMLQNVWPPLGRDHRGTVGGGGGVPAKPPCPPLLQIPPPSSDASLAVLVRFASRAHRTPVPHNDRRDGSAAGSLATRGPSRPRSPGPRPPPPNLWSGAGSFSSAATAFRPGGNDAWTDGVGGGGAWP